MLNRLKIAVRGFRYVGLAFALFVLANSVFFSLTLISPGLRDGLSLSIDRPWGVVTSVFVHENAGHLVGNLEGFTLWSLIFLLMNFQVSPEFRNRMSKIFFGTVFLAGVVVNLAELGVWWATGKFSVVSRGSSGLVYAALGAAFASALIVLPRNLEEFWFRMARGESRRMRDVPGAEVWRTFILWALAVGFSVAVIYKLVFDPSEFFSQRQGVDVLGHALGFFLGFSGASVCMLLAFRHPPSGSKSVD